MGLDKNKDERDNTGMNKDENYIKDHPDYYGEDE
jgi:hypothetical protein